MRDPEAADADGDGVITREELTSRLSNWQGGGRRGGGASAGAGDAGGSDAGGEASRSESRRGAGDNRRAAAPPSTGASRKKSYRFLTATERLPEGLPEFFARSDADGDGQVMMSEYTTRWTDEKAAEFARYDVNGDGVITPSECLRADRS
jgi:Ca2+-binding EF-hand superfamily protein